MEQTLACVLNRFSRVRLFVILWTEALQTPRSMGFSRKEYWSGLPCPPPGDLPGPGIEPMSLMSPALAGRFFTTSITWKPLKQTYLDLISGTLHLWSPMPPGDFQLYHYKPVL